MKIALLLPNMRKSRPKQITDTSEVFKYSDRVWQPIMLATLDAILEQKGHKTEIVDATALNYNLYDILDAVKYSEIIVVQSRRMDYYASADPNFQYVLDTINFLKENTASKIIVIGPYPTYYPSYFTQADYLVTYEPEITLPKLIRKKETENCSRRIWNGDPPDLNKLPHPNFHKLPMSKYESESIDMPRKPFAWLTTARGCTFKCMFCLAGRIFQTYRERSLDLVFEELTILVEKYKIKSFMFMDYNFTYNRKRAVNICKGIIERGWDFKWTCETRGDLLDKTMIKLLAKAGCVGLGVGVENLSSSVQKDIKKQFDVYEVVRLIKKAGIEPSCPLLMGLPNETLEDLENALKFTEDLKIQHGGLKPVIPYVGTPLHRYGKKQGIIKNDTSEEVKRNMGAFSEVSKEQQLQILHKFLKIRRKLLYKKMLVHPRFALKVLKHKLRRTKWFS